jgi:allantoinase
MPEYGPFPYSAIVDRPRISWPNGAHVAFWVIPNIEFFALDAKVPKAAGGTDAPVPDVPTWSMRDYGNRVGVFRLMKVMEKHGIRGTVALNSSLCARHPNIIAAGNALGWEWMGHNRTNTERLNAVPPEEEPVIINETLHTIEEATGTRPQGWLSSGLQETFATPGLLASAGVKYVADWVNDDQPYEMEVGDGRTLLSVPYSYDVNDKGVFESLHWTAAQFGELIRRQFDVLYREGAESGRVMAVALHPYISGVPHRIDALDEALGYVARHPHVWLATGAEIAAHYRRHKACESG